jgi:putative transposase
VSNKVQQGHGGAVNRFSEEPMVKFLREADKAPVAEVAKKHGISEVKICAWRTNSALWRRWTSNDCGQLKLENGRLKKLVMECVFRS